MEKKRIEKKLSQCGNTVGDYMVRNSIIMNVISNENEYENNIDYYKFQLEKFEGKKTSLQKILDKYTK